MRRPRKRFWLLSGVAVLVVLVVGGVLGYKFLLNPASPAKLKLDGGSSAGTLGDPAGTWQPASGSVAGYRIRERFATATADNDAVGRTGKVTGSLAVGGSDGHYTLRSVTVTVDMTSIASDQSLRDDRMKTIGLQTATYRTATFAVTGPVDLPAGATSGKQVKVDVPGRLTLHGTTRAVTLELTVQATSDRINVLVSQQLTLTDYGIDPPKIGGFVSVQPTGTIEAKVAFARQK
jgi:polyisoprenoid-binding protein YceI